VLQSQSGGLCIPVEVAHPVGPVGGETGNDASVRRQQARDNLQHRPLGARRDVHQHVSGQHDHIERSRCTSVVQQRGGQREQIGGRKGWTRVAVGGDSDQAAVPIDPDRGVAHPVQCGGDSAGAAAGVQDPGVSGRQHIDEPRLSLQIGAFGEFPGEPVDVEVPSVTGDGPLPAGRGRVGTDRAGHLRMMARSPRLDAADCGLRAGRVDRVPPETVTLQLPVVGPFAADDMLSFLSTHLVTGVEYVDGRQYFRSLRLAGGTGTVCLTLPTPDDAPQVPATIRVDDPADLPQAIAHCRTLLDLDADSAAVDAVLSKDPALAPAVAAMPGLRVPGAVDGPEILVRAMLGQQVSVAGAQTAASRLVLAADDRLPLPDGALTHLFPTPAAIAELGPGLIAGPRRRASAICSAAAAMAEGSLIVTADRSTETLTTDLVSRPGIGPWTAGYVAMRLLGDRDVLLTTDLVLRAGAALLGLPATPTALAARSSGWRPFRAYAGMHLWPAALGDRARSKRARVVAGGRS